MSSNDDPKEERSPVGNVRLPTETMSSTARMSASRAIFRPNEVKGILGHSERKPDRYFYILYLKNDTVWEWDGYCVPQVDAPPLWSIIAFCPRCFGRGKKEYHLKIDSTRKLMQLDDRGLEFAEPIRCPYDGEFGGACSFAVAVEPPRKREEKFVTMKGGVQVRIDAIAKDV